MDNCIAIDVSKQVLNVFDGKRSFTVRNERGLKELKAYIEKRYPHVKNRSDIAKSKCKSKAKGKKSNYRKEIKKDSKAEVRNSEQSEDDFYVIFEPTGIYSNYLKEFCADNRIKAYIVNPKKTSNFAKVIGNRSKTDKTDAKMLYAFNVLINKDELKVPSSDNISDTLSSYLSMYWFVIKMRISVSNYVEMLKYTNIEHSDKTLVSLLKKEAERFKDIQEEIIGKAEELVKSDNNIKKKYECLLSIPGIGKASAVALISLFLKYPDTNRAEITALTGLDPIRKESGVSVRGMRRISKTGNKMIRKMLYTPTMNAIQHNEVIKSFYERLVNEKHKPKKVALIASMKKLLLIAHSVYKSETTFWNNFLDKHSVKLPVKTDKANQRNREEKEQASVKEEIKKQVNKEALVTNKTKSKQSVINPNHLIIYANERDRKRKRKYKQEADKKTERKRNKTKNRAKT